MDDAALQQSRGSAICPICQMDGARCIGALRQDIMGGRSRTVEPSRPSFVSDRPQEYHHPRWTSSPKYSTAFASVGHCSSTSNSAIRGAWRCHSGPYALFHYLSRGSATLALEQGQELQMTAGDFVVISRGEPHRFYSDRQAPPFSVTDFDRSSAHLGPVRHGGSAQPNSTMICGKFTVARPSRGSVLELLPPVPSPEADGGTASGSKRF